MSDINNIILIETIKVKLNSFKKDYSFMVDIVGSRIRRTLNVDIEDA